jgi:hypothetical protein
MKLVPNGLVMFFAAKKQCIIQVIKLQDLPEQGPKRFHGRPVSQYHHQWMNKQR